MLTLCFLAWSLNFLLCPKFLIMPKGTGFVEYPVFERGYEALKAITAEFSQLDPEKFFL